jgi:manganese oxidase
MYHTHLNDIEQITSGLYGALLVTEPGKPVDPKRDHVIIVGWDSSNGPEVVNGDSASGPPIHIKAGEPQRFRFINIGPANRKFFSIRKDTTVVDWRALAKDGADLPASRAVRGRAIVRLNVGEMYDAEFTAPEKGEYILAVGRPAKRMQYTRKLIVH